MKKILLSVSILMCIFIMGCSKKSDPKPPLDTKHTFKITATSEKEIIVDVAVLKKGETEKKYVNGQTITGSYEYSLDLNVGDKLWLEVVNSTVANVVTCMVYDNGKAYGTPVTSSSTRFGLTVDVK